MLTNKILKASALIKSQSFRTKIIYERNMNIQKLFA